ncbi:MAG: hypothetical protein ACLQSR_08275 [Limisphaerales bacterium]
MSDNKFSRRRRSGMRFRPKGGLGQQPQKPDRDATQARADVVSEQGGSEHVFEKRHTSEIDRAENIAAGLPAEGAPATAQDTPMDIPNKTEFREPHVETPPIVQAEKEFQPVAIQQQPKGILDSIKNAATNLVKRVQRLIRPEKKIHKEVIINAETLETRVAVTEDGKLEEFNIERTTEERLVGSIFKGRVRNLEDGLKAAFVDIGFEKNAFLHYWDIVPSQFDSGVEIVEREGRRRDKPKITQKDTLCHV